ncbi:MAG: Gfo/Idh/MocA family oxidoreductase [Alphaproteobacteria bacterium]
MNETLRTVIVGFGRIADRLADDEQMARHFRFATHAQALRAVVGFHWDAVVDPDEEALRRARERWGIEIAVRDVADLSDTRFDVAVLATPPDRRIAVLDRLPGLRAIVVEKPLGTSRAETERFAALVRERGLVVQVNYWRRFDGGSSAVRGLLPVVGRPQAACGLYGNGLRNNGSHLIDLVRMALGEIAEARALGPARPVSEAPIAGDVDIPFALTLRDATIVTALTLDFHHYREVGLDIWYETGRIAFMQESLSIRHFPVAEHRALVGAREIASDRPRDLTVVAGDALRGLYIDLHQALRHDRATNSGLGNALANERIVEAIVESARRGGAALACGPGAMSADAD